MTTTAVHETPSLPFRADPAARPEILPRLLEDHGYTTHAVCGRMGIPELYAFKTIREGRTDHLQIADALDVLIRLFLDGEAVRRSVVHEYLRDAAVGALAELGLLHPHPADAERYAASVQLYPTEGLYVVSDCGPSAPGLTPPDEPLRADSVYAAITQNTRNFVRTLPSTPCERLLELCSGTGIAALVGSRFAKHAWAVDITERSTRFAEFNARLNGIRNVTALQGDLYEPVAGMTFDRIVAHPPYVPSPERTFIYAHAGHDGEEIIRGILAGLADHLSPGGRFYCTCASTDRRGAPLEQRIRAMLGEREAEFDVFMVEHYGYHPSEFYFRLAVNDEITFEKAERHHHLFRELEAERTVYCTMVVQRHRTPRPALTVRRDRGEQARSREVEWLVDWYTAVADGGIIPRLLDAYPAVSPHARLQVTHAAEQGGWRAERCQVVTGYPFPRTVELSTGAAMLLAACDGSASTRERLRQLRDAGAVPPEMTEEAFAGFVQNLVGEGVLVLAEEPASEPAP
jgi:SAM-dependent methyltransferase